MQSMGYPISKNVQETLPERDVLRAVGMGTWAGTAAGGYLPVPWYCNLVKMYRYRYEG